MMAVRSRCRRDRHESPRRDTYLQRSRDYLNNRHYNPTTGTFLSVDPLVTKTMQPYIYGAANPVTYSDPDGLDPDTASWIRHQAADEAGDHPSPGGRGPKSTNNGCTYSSTSWSCTRYVENEDGRAEPVHTERPRTMRNGVFYVGGYKDLDQTFGGQTLGTIWGYAVSVCYIICLKGGLSSGEGPYGEVGVGLAVDSPAIGLDDEPDCGGERNEIFASGSAGPAQVGGIWTFPDGGNIQDGSFDSATGVSVSPSDFKRVSPGAGGGFTHWWTFC